MSQQSIDPKQHVAVVGMACRFPGAANLDAFWSNVRNGVESVTFFNDEELVAAGVPKDILLEPNYVKAAALLERCEDWDAPFFNVPPREAAIIDPQHRLFLECCWAGLSHAGYDSAQTQQVIGVYGGAAMNTYAFNFFSPRNIRSAAEMFQAVIGNDKDYLTTRVAYMLDLKGPAVTVQTACSSSLSAVHLASQGLLEAECDIALAGGVSVKVPQKTGYFHQEGMIFSPDGHCRAFDSEAQGCLFGSGVGVVVLKRLADALRDGDTIYAVQRGSAWNNDGAVKVGYTAPSVDGQSDVIAAAWAMADIEADSLQYIEAHGTGTPLGDPIEIEALRRVFRDQTERKQFCAIGSVKTNFGHLDAAAGIAGYIKTVLMLQHREIAPSLNYTKPNPHIDFSNSPLYVAAELCDWKRNGAPRRAGVSSFGIGGTNVHVVLEEAPEPEAVAARVGARPLYLLPVSAKTPSALQVATEQLVHHLETRVAEAEDVAYTLQIGRRAMAHRRFVVCRSLAEGARALKELDPKTVYTFRHDTGTRPVAFLFPGGGAQHVNMARSLYAAEPTFRRELDACAERFEPQLGFDIRHIMFPPERQQAEAIERIKAIEVALPTLFATEYALAQLLMSWGLTPEAMIGHSIGEYVAAHLAGVFSFEDVLELVATRGRLMAKAPAGSMFGVPLSEAGVQKYLPYGFEVAVINGPSACVVSGPRARGEELVQALARDGVEASLIPIDVASHCSLIEPVLGEFADVVRRFKLSEPKIPMISNVTGTWVQPGQLTRPEYWSEHLRKTVRFSEGLVCLMGNAKRILMEVGPGVSLSTLTRRHPEKSPEQVVIATLPHAGDGSAEDEFFLQAVGKAWMAGGAVQWERLYGNARPRRIALPSYPFEGQRYWIDPVAEPSLARASVESNGNGHVSPAQAPPTRAARHPRPNLMTALVAPRSELERSICEAWQNAFGIEEVGVFDNFFELGGASLLATELCNSLNRFSPSELKVSDVLKAPTVAELANVIGQRTELERARRVASILQQLEQLSDEEAEQRLAQPPLES